MIERQHIIDEIKRTAEANGGLALGVRRFETETGIGPYAWGRFWPRFAEAQHEAGFASNEFVTAISEDMLLEHLITLIRDLGRYPTAAELSMRGRNDSRFPTEKVFRRIGDKQQKLGALLAYCHDRSGYEDIILLCEPHVVSAIISQEVEAPQGDVRVGYVYLLKFRRNDYKIGASMDPERRFGEIATKMPEAPVNSALVPWHQLHDGPWQRPMPDIRRGRVGH